MTRFKNTCLAMLVLAAFALTGCGLLPGSSSPVEGVQWDLVGSSMNSIDFRDMGITARFDGEKVSGSSGVNTYSGTYETGMGNSLKIGQIAATEMAGDESRMRAEAAYLQLLAGVGSYKVAGRTLTLYDASGNESLIFQARAR